MKKFVFLTMLLAALVFAFAACGRGGEEGADPTPSPTPTQGADPTPTPAPTPPPAAAGSREYVLAQASQMSADPGSVIVIAHGTRADQNILAGWTNPSPNAQARTLMGGGLGTMSRNHYNNFFPNPLVMQGGAWPEVRDNPDGSRTYTFTIYPYNRFSDGTPITAMHYVSHALFLSPQWGTLVASQGDVMWLQGRLPYIAGEVDYLASVRLYNDTQFSVTADAAHLPNVWEAAMQMSAGPTPLHMYGVEIRDNGRGTYLVAIGGGEMTAEALYDIVMGGNERRIYTRTIDAETGESEYVYDADGNRAYVTVTDGVRFNPTVSAGPYVFESVDVGSGNLTLRANPYFPGTWDGFRPRIERIIFRFTPPALMVDALGSGEAHVLESVSDGTALENALDQLVGGGTHNFVNFDQFGQRLIQFHTDTGPTQFRAVRQALSFMIDRHVINEMVGRGFSVVAHGPWAPAWWWYVQAAERDLYDRITIYDFDMERAIALLEEDGWVYNADGTPFVRGVDTLRHKWVDEWDYVRDEEGIAISRYRFVHEYTYDYDEYGELVPARGRPIRSNRIYTGERVLMPLIINWVVGTADNPGRDHLEMQLFDRLEYAGGLLQQTRSDRWGAILQGGYREVERYQMMYLGVGMGTIWTPWQLMSLEWIPNNNWGQVDCEITRELSDRFRVMDITTPAGVDAFVEAFIDYMAHLTYEAYTLPVRMALVHDFFPVELGGWFNTGVWGLAEAIQRTYWR